MRAAHGFSQGKLAEIAGMSVKRLGKMKRGTVNASIKCLTDIAKALSLPLMGGAMGSLLASLRAICYTGETARQRRTANF